MKKARCGWAASQDRNGWMVSGYFMVGLSSYPGHPFVTCDCETPVKRVLGLCSDNQPTRPCCRHQIWDDGVCQSICLFLCFLVEIPIIDIGFVRDVNKIQLVFLYFRTAVGLCVLKPHRSCPIRFCKFVEIAKTTESKSHTKCINM